ncbi:MAG: Tad domain-containing protein [Planctomycetaceae bacterium]|nr:Tad domain-containing protein [Planctomycetaceae bacterium]
MRNTSHHQPSLVTAAQPAGNTLVLAASSLVMLFGFTAFAVDVGYITLTKAELQKTADAAVLAATLELYEGWGSGATISQSQAAANARQAAAEVAAANRSAGNLSTYVDSQRDVRLGNLQWNSVAGEWVKTWDVGPYNLAEVTVRRDQPGSSQGDGPLDLFFAKIIGHENANLRVSATAAIQAGIGVRKIPGVNVGVLPIAVDVGSWDDLITNGNGSDQFGYDEFNKSISGHGDGVVEMNIYPTGSAGLPPGNRGTVDFGSSNNSTADISRQILYGLNDSDLQAMGGELRFDQLPMMINGDTGLSAGIKDELWTIRGEPRLMPLFDSVSGPGNNAYYRIVRFVPVRILDVQLTGKPSSKRVIVQSAPFTDATVIPGKVEIQGDSVLSPVSLIP